MTKDNLLVGPYCFVHGIRLIFSPNIKRYLFVPIIVNIFLMIAIVVGAAFFLNSYLASLLLSYPAWVMVVLGGIIWILYGLLSWLVGTLIFTLMTNLIACPFYGLLSEAIEQKIEGKKHHPNPMNFAQITMHTFLRELRKLVYFIPWLLLCLLLLPFPVLWPVFPIVWWAVMSWIMAVQYCDYSADNRQVSFKNFRSMIQKYPMAMLSFGATVSVALMIPIFNLVVPAAAVAGGTALYLGIEAKRLDFKHLFMIKQ